MNQVMRIKAGMLLTVAVLGLIVLVAFSQQQEQQNETAVDLDAYQEMMSFKVADIYDLEDWFFEQQDTWLPILPPAPDFILRQSGYPSVLPFDWKGLPAEFVENLTWEYENSVPVYPITILEDFETRETVFLNGEGKEIYCLPPADDYDPYSYLKWLYPDLYSGAYSEDTIAWLESLYDPARIWIDVKLIPAEYVEAYLYAAAKIQEEAQKAQDEGGGGGGGMLLGFGEDYTNHLWAGIEGPAAGLTNIEIACHTPDGFTNRLEIFTCTNLLDFWWTLAATNLSTEGTNVIYWTYDPWASESPIFFALGNADVDSDGDGIVDAREKFLYHTDPNLWDTDGDGFSDGDEINVYVTDPLDKYSVPPPEMLSVSGKYLVDESTNPVVLKSVNIGAWLQWEQFMVRFKPFAWTNEWGKVYDLFSPDPDIDEIDAGQAREFLMENVDNSVTLLAADAPMAYNVKTDTVTGSWTWLCDDGVRYIADVHNGDWVGFTTDFGSGVSNLAIALAVPSNDAGRQIKVRVGSPSNPDIGSLTTKATAPNGLGEYSEWATFTEQYLTLSTNLSGTQTVYFVGSSSGGAIGNLYRFRFFNNATNTENLFTTFRDNYITTNDLDRIRELGYNCIRLPFFHTLLEDDGNPYVYKQSGWDRLDWVIEQCRIRHLWVILDLHSTPGGQNHYQASGFRDPFRNRLWHSTYYQDRTAALWVEIANRYKTNPVVAGYDLFNEPVPYTTDYSNIVWTTAQAFSNNILPMLSRLHGAIRSNDTSHVLFMESNLMYTNMWAGKDYLWWPSPAAKGWTNVCYEFHVYDRTVYGTTGSDEDSYFITQKPICDTMIRSFTELRETRNVPVYVGEYAPWNEQNFDYWTRQLQANDFHWGHWNYRSWGWDNPSKPEEGKTLWGLDYRSKDTTNAIPDLQNDSLSDLQWKVAWYGHTNYTDNTHLQDVAGRHTENPELSKGKCQFYLNTFDGPDSDKLSDGWPWRKLAAVGQSNAAFTVHGRHARLLLGWGPTLVRLESREEADARFDIADATGCRFSADPIYFYVATNAVGSDAAITVSAARESITAPILDYDTEAVVARLLYDQTGDSITLMLYAKDGGTNTLGVEKAEVTGLTFVPSNTLELFVTATDATLSYGGTEYTNVAHGLDLSTWPDGAVCVMEVEDLASGGTVFADLDNFKGWRDEAGTDALFQDAFATYPDGVEIRAETEYLSVEDYYATGRKTASFATNAYAFWIPKECAPSQKYGTWMNVRRDYHNDARLPASSTNVIEVRAAFTNFTQGIGKIVMMREYLPIELYWEYAGQALYVEFERDGANIEFIAYRHDGIAGNRDDRAGSTNTYVDGRSVSLQADTNTMRVYYGPDLVIDTTHALTNMTAVFGNGVYPHYEIQNDDTSTNAYVLVEDVVCRALSDFAAPEE